MAKAIKEQGLYGEVSIRHELAKGVYQLVLAAKQSALAIIIGKDLAAKVLAKSALDRADEYNGEYLGFPDEDGRMSIPMYELDQRGYIDLPLAEAKAHFNNIFHMIPDYLRERGILKEKPLPDMQSKLAQETRDFQKSIQSRSKADIMKAADEIVEFGKVRDILAADDLPLKNQGLLMLKDDLIRSTLKKLKENNQEITAENVLKICDDIDKTETADKKSIDAALSDITSELRRTQVTGVRSVIMELTSSRGAKSLVLSSRDFEDLLLTDEIKSEFAKKYMPDYPAPDHYGEQNKWIFESLFLKRFGEDLITNWKRFAPQGEDIQLEIKELSTEVMPYDSYGELKSRYQIKEYLEAAYSDPEAYVERVLDPEKIDEYRKTINEIQGLVDKAADKKAIEEKPAAEQEAAEQQDIEFVTEQSDEANTDNESLKMLNAAKLITPEAAEKLAETIVEERLQDPHNVQAFYVLNKQQPDEVIKLSTAYDSRSGQIKLNISSYVAGDIQSSITNLSKDDLKDYVNNLTDPVMMTSAEYKNYREQRIIEQAESFEKEASPFMQMSEIPVDYVSSIISNMAIDNISGSYEDLVSSAADQTAVVEEAIEEIEFEI